MTDPKYPLAPNGVFRTVQGEGVLLGEPMVFIRLAGCNVNCDGCDTDYSVAGHATAAEIGRRAAELATPATRWAWITGGEPTIHQLRPLVGSLKRAGFAVALATSGVRSVVRDAGGVDFVSVSPHRLDSSWVCRRGEQLNLVPGLGSLTLADMDKAEWLGEFQSGFGAKFVTPAEGGDVAACVEWVNRHPGYRLGVQAHKTWGLA